VGPFGLNSFLDCRYSSVSRTLVCWFESEIDRYLVDPDVTTGSIWKYPQLAEAFMNYKSALPISAVVERLFSCGGQTHGATQM